MHKIKGFRIRHKFVKVVRWGLHRRQQDCNYTAITMTKLCGFVRNLKNSAKDICFRKSKSNYIRLGVKEKKSVPKGHLAVYVGEKEDDAHRVLVPVILFNHPLFGSLLKEAEKVYGFNYDGGIHVPCRISEFENVQTKINGGGSCNKFRARQTFFKTHIKY